MPACCCEPEPCELEAEGDDFDADELEADGDDFDSDPCELDADGEDFDSDPCELEGDGDDGELVADGALLLSLSLALSCARALVAMNNPPTSVAMMVRFI